MNCDDQTFWMQAFWWTALALLCVSLYAWVLKQDLKDFYPVENKQKKRFDPLPSEIKFEKAKKTIDLIKEKARKPREIQFRIIDEAEEVDVG